MSGDEKYIIILLLIFLVLLAIGDNRDLLCIFVSLLIFGLAFAIALLI